MKKTSWIICILTAGLIAFSGVGCKKQAASGQPQTLQDGVAQLRKALVGANAQVQSNLYSGVDYGIRYGKFMDALAAMDQITSDPSLNDAQKKAANNVIQLLQQAITNAPAAPAP
jgi:hypothetical protein